MQQNIGPLDRAVRLIVGIGLLSLVVVGPQTWWGLVGLAPLVTSLIGWCPPYAVFGLNTCPTRRGAR